MRRARITWQGAFHHVMNRGLRGEEIFQNPDFKLAYLQMLREESEKFKIRIFAYCVMDNHFHLILENTTGRLSDFQKQLNGKYGIYYNRKKGNSGYVFQGRFQSTLIENDFYLMTSIAYTLANPVRAGIVEGYCDYQWSSANDYFQQGKSNWLDVEFVNELFHNKMELNRQVEMNISGKLPVYISKVGKIMGRKEFIPEAERRYDRRKKQDGVKRKRENDRYFEPVEKIIFEFERKHGFKIEEISTETFAGKRLRGELLVLLKDLTGLKYHEIAELPIFSDLQYSSIGGLYRDTKRRIKRKENK